MATCDVKSLFVIYRTVQGCQKLLYPYMIKRRLVRPLAKFLLNTQLLHAPAFWNNFLLAMLTMKPFSNSKEFTIYSKYSCSSTESNKVNGKKPVQEKLDKTTNFFLWQQNNFQHESVST